MPEVERQLTPALRDELLLAIAEAYVNVTGAEPSDETVAVAYSQIALETGGGAAIWNWNVGNIKCFDKCVNDPTKSFYSLPIAVGSEWPLQVAYEDLLDGCEAYWRLLHSPRYQSVLPLFDAGRPHEAAYELRACGYYTAPAEEYAAAMVMWYETTGVPMGEPPAADAKAELGPVVLIAAAVGIALLVRKGARAQ